MPRVRIPPVLRAETAGQRELEVAGSTVGDVLGELVRSYPGLAGRLLDQGSLAPFCNVFVDGDDVRALDGLATPVAADSTLLLLPAMAGGA